ncbi:hypothetical protein Fmac_020726 [Flemingia macrophylla]|uniref:Uncharacterized protein n=1 Tax=Flemingia macrophylla TaxID=520843 RepID=A0ABD1LUV7_9FABA
MYTLYATLGSDTLTSRGPSSPHPRFGHLAEPRAIITTPSVPPPGALGPTLEESSTVFGGAFGGGACGRGACSRALSGVCLPAKGFLSRLLHLPTNPTTTNLSYLIVIADVQETPDVDVSVLKIPEADVEVVADKDVENDGHAIGNASGNAHFAVPLAAANKAAEGNGAARAKKLVFFGNASPAFDLEDLLTASAEVLGTFGTTYRVVLEASPVVAIKTLMQRRSDKFV